MIPIWIHADNNLNLLSSRIQILSNNGSNFVSVEVDAVPNNLQSWSRGICRERSRIKCFEADDDVEILKPTASYESRPIHSSGATKTPTLTKNWASDGESDFDGIEEEVKTIEEPVDDDGRQYINDSHDGDFYSHDSFSQYTSLQDETE